MMKTDYTYAAAYVKSLENNMLGQDEFAAIMNSEDSAEVVRVLKTKGYMGDNLSEMLENERLGLWQLCFELCPDEPQLKTLMLANDYHNIKAVLKSVMSGRSWEALVYEPSAVEPQELADAFKKAKFEDLDERFSKNCAMAYELYAKNGDAREVEIFLDRCELEQMLEESSGFVREYAEISALCANLRIFLRSGPHDADFLDSALVNCSLISKQELVSSRRSKEETLKEEGYKEAYELYSHSPEAFEKYCDDLVCDHAKKAETSFFEFDAVAGYFIGKMTELKNIRIAAYGKKNNMAQEEIRERLRKTYV